MSYQTKPPYGEHSYRCNFCRQWMDMRDLAQVMEHEHNGQPGRAPSIWEYEDYNEFLDEYGKWKEVCKKLSSVQAVKVCDANTPNQGTKS